MHWSLRDHRITGSHQLGSCSWTPFLQMLIYNQARVRRELQASIADVRLRAGDPCCSVAEKPAC